MRATGSNEQHMLSDRQVALMRIGLAGCGFSLTSTPNMYALGCNWQTMRYL